ncbi:hypothetical protein J6590_007557 [Homalodisca vitripennis]|nr:hypothetical protein J6590_007557 [Homalodisca vitripennis]
MRSVDAYKSPRVSAHVCLPTFPTIPPYLTAGPVTSGVVGSYRAQYHYYARGDHYDLASVQMELI